MGGTARTCGRMELYDVAPAAVPRAVCLQLCTCRQESASVLRCASWTALPDPARTHTPVPAKLSTDAGQRAMQAWPPGGPAHQRAPTGTGVHVRVDSAGSADRLKPSLATTRTGWTGPVSSMVKLAGHPLRSGRRHGAALLTLADLMARMHQCWPWTIQWQRGERVNVRPTHVCACAPPSAGAERAGPVRPLSLHPSSFSLQASAPGPPRRVSVCQRRPHGGWTAVGDDPPAYRHSRCHRAASTIARHAVGPADPYPSRPLDSRATGQTRRALHAARWTAAANVRIESVGVPARMLDALLGRFQGSPRTRR
ncbi:hypothetical protein C8Q80DRAFT_130932 [Daedaleopsis nitida]|nr:hypothetical protein C8Q80DRAFT_130932 [Daedaleopsis nitida]